MLQVSSDLDYLISSSNASALFLKTLYPVCSCSVALELDQKKQQETNFRFPTLYLIYIYTHPVNKVIKCVTHTSNL